MIQKREGTSARELGRRGHASPVRSLHLTDLQLLSFFFFARGMEDQLCVCVCVCVCACVCVCERERERERERDREGICARVCLCVFIIALVFMVLLTSSLRLSVSPMLDTGCQWCARHCRGRVEL